MTAKLEDYLFHLRRILGEGAYPLSAKAYLDDWSGGQTGYLRKFYPARGEETEYDLTSASEKVIELCHNRNDSAIQLHRHPGVGRIPVFSICRIEPSPDPESSQGRLNPGSGM